MNTEQRLETLERIFALARINGLCKTQKEFAGLIGVHPSTISLARKGDEKYLTERLLRQVVQWAKLAGIDGEKSEPQPQPDIIIPAATAELYCNMSETIRIQAEMLARMQAEASDVRK